MPDAPLTRSQDPDHMAWIDLEMTGLDASSHVILQAAVIVTDGALTPLEEYVVDIWQPEQELDRMVPFVRDMHDRNGLTDRVRTSRVDVAQAERELLQRVSGWCPYPVVLCGNSVHTDVRFIERHMPGLAGYLHHRIIDVSSIKVLAERWYGEGAVFDKPTEGAHDALVDIRNSIAELAHYRQSLFRKQAGPADAGR